MTTMISDGAALTQCQAQASQVAHSTPSACVRVMTDLATLLAAAATADYGSAPMTVSGMLRCTLQTPHQITAKH